MGVGYNCTEKPRAWYGWTGQSRNTGQKCSPTDQRLDSPDGPTGLVSVDIGKRERLRLLTPCNKHGDEVGNRVYRNKVGFPLWQPFIRRLRRTGREEPSEKSPTVELTLV